MYHANSQRHKRSAASQRDLLQVQSGTSLIPAAPEQRLQQMGFRVSQPAPDHWILRGRQPLPELHFYSLAELGRFAENRATFYQDNLRPSTLKETTL